MVRRAAKRTELDADEFQRALRFLRNVVKSAHGSMGEAFLIDWQQRQLVLQVDPSGKVSISGPGLSNDELVPPEVVP